MNTDTTIAKYWRDFYMLTTDHFYHVGARETNRTPMVEAIVMNYVPEKLKVAKRPEEQLLLLERRAEYRA